MLFYNYIYASWTTILDEWCTGDSKFTAILLVGASQLLHIALIAGLLRYYVGIEIIPKLSSPYNTLFFTLPLLLLLIIYYSIQR